MRSLLTALLFSAIPGAWCFQPRPSTTTFPLAATTTRLQEKTNGDSNSDENGDLFNGYRINGYTMQGGQYENSLEERGAFVQKVFGPRPIELKNKQDEDDEDGYKEMRNKKRPLWVRPLKLAKSVLFPKPPLEPGTLILVRHGESLWNANKTFTGWADPGLSEKGLRECEHAARLLLAGGYEIDLVFCSRLQRAVRSTWAILSEMDQVYKPVFKSWRLNERMYGALTGLCKFETAEQLGAELVQEWRGSLRTRPPALTPQDAYWVRQEFGVLSCLLSVRARVSLVYRSIFRFI